VTSQEVIGRVYAATHKEVQAALKQLLEQCAREDEFMPDGRRYLHTSEIYRLLLKGMTL
jgi:hypothetical protein